MQLGPLLPKEGGLIQVDIGGHPPFPTGSKQFSGNFGSLPIILDHDQILCYETNWMERPVVH
jgi:hypothetical protein